ncbi:MAG: serine hydrolase [Dermatophilaceae bacterium]
MVKPHPGALELASEGRATWSVLVRDLRAKTDVFGVTPGRVLPTSSVAKIFLLVEVAFRLHSGALSPDDVLHRSVSPAVADSGLWQHLSVESLTVADAATLIASVSDNLATNVLLARVGLHAVQDRSQRLGARRTALLDIVRDQRGPRDPVTLSVGSAREWVDILEGIWAGHDMSPGVRRQLLRWLSLNTDTSMVAEPLGVDPLSHPGADHGVRLWNKTGSASGTRADVGIVGGRTDLCYAVIARWDETSDPTARHVVRADLHRIGETVAKLAGAD